MNDDVDTRGLGLLRPQDRMWLESAIVAEFREPAAAVEELRVVPHINGRLARLSWVRGHGTDVTAEMREAWRTLNRLSP